MEGRHFQTTCSHQKHFDIYIVTNSWKLQFSLRWATEDIICNAIPSHISCELAEKFGLYCPKNSWSVSFLFTSDVRAVKCRKDGYNWNEFWAVLQVIEKQPRRLNSQRVVGVPISSKMVWIRKSFILFTVLHCTAICTNTLVSLSKTKCKTVNTTSLHWSFSKGEVIWFVQIQNLLRFPLVDDLLTYWLYENESSMPSSCSPMERFS